MGNGLASCGKTLGTDDDKYNIFMYTDFLKIQIYHFVGMDMCFSNIIHNQLLNLRKSNGAACDSPRWIPSIVPG